MKVATSYQITRRQNPEDRKIWHVWWAPEETFESRTVHRGFRNSYAWSRIFGADSYGTITFLH